MSDILMSSRMVSSTLGAVVRLYSQPSRTLVPRDKASKSNVGEQDSSSFN